MRAALAVPIVLALAGCGTLTARDLTLEGFKRLDGVPFLGWSVENWWSPPPVMPRSHLPPPT